LAHFSLLSVDSFTYDEKGWAITTLVIDNQPVEVGIAPTNQVFDMYLKYALGVWDDNTREGGLLESESSYIR